jgi:sugar phosphate isomerase/epimerase
MIRGRTLGSDDLVLCAGSLAQVGLFERCQAAARAGFTGVSLFLSDLDQARAAGHSDADIRAMLEGHGLAVAELDPLLSWVEGSGVRAGGDGAAFAGYSEEDFLRAADTFGARSINAVLFANEPVPHEQLVAGFAGVCDRAKQHGLLVHLEFMPFSQLRDIDSALSIVEAAGCDNGGLMFDVWHHFRGGGSDSTLRRAAPRVTATQLDDAPSQAEANLVVETLHRRLLPGDGDAGVAGLIRLLDEGGCTAPLGVEVFQDSLVGLPAAEVAKRLFEATRAVVTEARAGTPRARG